MDTQATEVIRRVPAQRRQRSRRRIRVPILLALFILLAAGAAAAYALRPQSDFALIGNRGAFAPGACALYSPTNGNNHHVVFIDPGHGGRDPGGQGQTSNGTVIHEKDVTLPVALDALAGLRAAGYHVAISRVTDTGVGRLVPGVLDNGTYTAQGVHADVQARVDCANAANAQLLLSIHFNSYGDPSVGGVETYYDPDRSFAGQNVRFARIVHQYVLAAFSGQGWNVPDRGIISDATLDAPTLTSQASSYGHLLELGPASPGWFDRPSRMPGALSESLFLTDPGEADVLVTDQGKRVLADAYVHAIEQYFAG